MMTEVKLLQLKKAYSPMLSTLFGMVTENNPSQSWNALSPMLTTPSGMISEPRKFSSHFVNTPFSIVSPFVAMDDTLRDQMYVPHFGCLTMSHFHMF